MANKAVFLDRDRTVIEDPGYLSDPSAVKLLPGVELAIKSLALAGYRRVVVTNQSGVARGLLTEEALVKIHAEMQRQLAEKGAHLDGIYYCPYHPEGTVEGYAIDSDLRKPKPGMLRKAADDLDIDLSASWMVGDGPRDVEAGQRAGCRTVRIRTTTQPPGEEMDEDVQADFNVRNLVDAARLILREDSRTAADEAATAGAAAPGQPAPSPPAEDLSAAPREITTMGDSQVRREILQHLRQFVHSQAEEEFSLAKLVGSIIQVLALLAVLIGFIRMIGDAAQQAMLWLLIALVLQVMSLTAFTFQRKK